MKIINKTVYQCDHCGRKMFGKGAMSRHEMWCKENPNNKHKCFEFCKYLNKTTVYGTDEYGEHTFHHTDMFCEARSVLMYSFKLEKHRTRPPEAFDGLERMPLECEFYNAPTNCEI